MELISVLFFIVAFVISLIVGFAAGALWVFIGEGAFGRQDVSGATWLVQIVVGIVLALLWWLATSSQDVWGSLCGSCFELYLFSKFGRNRGNGRF